ncbi:gag-pol polyprotein [Hordeum vulgare]|nr:gag-pol polyprotein [Hordeum vulgare]
MNGCEGHELDTNHRSMTSPPTLASSPSDFKASSPFDRHHLHRQAPQEKLPKLKSATSMSYYDFDIDFEIPFYGTHELEEYLEWGRKMDTCLKMLTCWLHIP